MHNYCTKHVEGESLGWARWARPPSGAARGPRWASSPGTAAWRATASPVAPAAGARPRRASALASRRAAAAAGAAREGPRGASPGSAASVRKGRKQGGSEGKRSIGLSEIYTRYYIKMCCLVTAISKKNTWELSGIKLRPVRKLPTVPLRTATRAVAAAAVTAALWSSSCSPSPRTGSPSPYRPLGSKTLVGSLFHGPRALDVR